jgi:hypothetical protein
MFSQSPKRKMLCTCGAITDVDAASVNVKRVLGKPIECRACRNERIARELSEGDDKPESEEALWL